MTHPSVILVTDPKWSFARIEDVIVRAASGLPDGGLLVQLRDKAARLADLANLARALRAVTRAVDARFVVNASTSATVDLAYAIGADGVHVPCRRESIAEARRAFAPSAWISTPAHDDTDVVTATRSGASAVLVSPVFASPGKGAPRGVAALETARAIAAPSTLIYALGGIDERNASACAAADGVAVIRALLDAKDAASVAQTLAAPFRAPARPRA